MGVEAMKDTRLNVAKAGAIICLASLGMGDAFRLSDKIKTGSVLHEVVGPDLYLKIVSAVLMLCGLLLLVTRWIWTRRSARKIISRETDKTVQAGSVAIAYLMYVFAVPVLGYLLGSVFFFTVVLCLFGYRPWSKGVLLGLGMAGACYYFFAHLLRVPLPKGWLGLAF